MTPVLQQGWARAASNLQPQLNSDGQCQCQTCNEDLKILLSDNSDILEVGDAAKACKMAKYSVTKRSSVPLSERTLLAVMVPIEARDT